MASSTTNPTESTIASRVRRLRENPKSCIKNNAPMREIGIATIGTSTDRNDLGDVTQSDERPLVLAHDELLELISGVQIRVRGQVHLQERTLRIADSGKEIVSR